MKVFGLDTSGDFCSTAIYDSESHRVLASERIAIERGHAEILFAQIARVTSAAGCALRSIDRFAVTTGPGSFTGVRIGIAAARGFALATAKPIIGMSTLEIVGAAARAPADAILVAAFDARRGELYCQAFAANISLTQPFAATPGNAAQIVTRDRDNRSVYLIGSGAVLLADALNQLGTTVLLAEGDAAPDAAVLARLAAQCPETTGRPAPLYLRAPDAKLPQRPLA